MPNIFSMPRLAIQIILLLLLPLSVLAQSPLQLMPIYRSPSTPIRKDVTATPLRLPFFDDFSGTIGRPDARLWEPTDSSVWVGDTFNNLAPSSGMATFDGADAFGRPYDFVNIFNSDTADRLLSREIDLTGLRQADSLYFAFYYQPEGFGERPGPEDSLRLQFLNRNNQWVTVWSVGGPSSADVQPFRQVRLTLENPLFFHPKFRFRFHNIGRLAGGFDTWNLDYVFFYKKADLQGRPLIDIALNKQPTSLLRRYRSMPMQQFRAAPQQWLADTVYAAVNNLSDTFNLFSPRLVVRNAASGQLLATLRTGAIGTNTSFAGTNIILRRESMTLAGVIPDALIGQLPTDSAGITYQFLIDSLSAERIPAMQNNDSIQATATLGDFFAYDDNTAEYAVGMFQRFGRLAYRFVATEPAVLTHVDIYFPQIGKSVARQSFNLMVWTQIDTVNEKNDQLASRQGIPFVYPDAINQFRRMPLPTPVLVQDTFYVGIQQLTEDPIPIGYDRNTVSGQEVFFNLGSKWQQNRLFDGSLMIRPVFSKEGNNPNAVDDPRKDFAVKLYPNPAQEQVWIDGQVDHAWVIDLQGRICQTVQFERGQEQVIDLAGLRPGLYLVRVQKGNRYATQKLLIE